jgi:phosphohistidine phosphatase
MKVFLLRHAEAHPGVPDEGRALTPRGHRQVKALARGVGRVPLAVVRVVEHSPLVRAVQTAEGLRAGAKSKLPLKVLTGLKPEDDPKKTARLLGRSRTSRLLVGHNPHLAGLVGLLLDLPPEAVKFRKGGLMALERVALPQARRPYGTWRLTWFVVPDFAK